MPLPAALALGGGSLVSGLISGLGQRSANKKSDQENARVQALIDNYMKEYQGYQGDLRSLFGPEGSLNSLLYGPQTTTSSGSTRSHSVEDTTPTFTPGTQALVDMLTKQFSQQLQRGTSLPPGYEATQTRAINESFLPAETAEANYGAKRGLPLDTLGSPIARAKAGAISDLRASLPLTEAQLLRQTQQDAGNAAVAFGKGSHNVGDTYGMSSSSTTSPANINSILNYLGLLAPHEPIIVGKSANPSALATGLSSGVNTGVDLYGLLSDAGVFKKKPKVAKATSYAAPTASATWPGTSWPGNI